MKDNLIELRNVSHSFGHIEVLDNIDLTIKRSEFVAIVGPSGCGKTTLLNLISDHQKPTSGTIIRKGTTRMVYQHDGLFPWLTVAENIMIGLRDIDDTRELRAHLDDALDLIGLHGFENHYPHQLSGGMRQRVELARALAGQSDILLMDEPFSALDYMTRLRMRYELGRLILERPRTVILITHDIEEAAQLADRIILITKRPGCINEELSISLPRPRDLTHVKVVNAVQRMLSSLHLESGSLAKFDLHQDEPYAEASGDI